MPRRAGGDTDPDEGALMDPDERPGRLSPVALYAVWLMAASFALIVAVIAAGYLLSFLSSR